MTLRLHEPDDDLSEEELEDLIAAYEHDQERKMDEQRLWGKDYPDYRDPIKT